MNEGSEKFVKTNNNSEHFNRGKINKREIADTDYKITVNFTCSVAERTQPENKIKHSGSDCSINSESDVLKQSEKKNKQCKDGGGCFEIGNFTVLSESSTTERSKTEHRKKKYKHNTDESDYSEIINSSINSESSMLEKPNTSHYEKKYKKSKGRSECSEIGNSFINSGSSMLERSKRKDAEKIYKQSKGGSDCSEIANTESSMFENSKTKHSKKKYKQSKSRSVCAEIANSSINSECSILEKSKSKHFGRKFTESKKISQDRNEKKLIDFEKSFIETLLEYYEAQSTPLSSEDEEQDSEKNGKTKYKKIKGDTSNDDNQIIATKKKEDMEVSSKRTRRNSGDCLILSSSENTDIEFRHPDETFTEKRKKLKLKISESVKDTSSTSKRKRSKGSDHSKIMHESEDKGSGSILDKENYSFNEMLSSERIKNTGETDVLQNKRQAKKRKQNDESNYPLCHSDSENNLSHDVSFTENIATVSNKKIVFTAEDEQLIGSSENKRKNTMEHDKYIDVSKAEFKKELEVESSESELDISVFFAKKNKTKENLVNPSTIDNYQNIRLKENKEIMSAEIKEDIPKTEKIFGEKRSSKQNNFVQNEFLLKNNGKIMKTVELDVFEELHHEQEMRDNLQIKSKKKKKHKSNSSLDDLLVTGEVETPTKDKGVSQKTHILVDDCSKELEKLNIGFENNDTTIEKSPYQNNINNCEPKGESNMPTNKELNTCTDSKSRKKLKMVKKEETNTVQEADLSNETFNLKNEELDISDDDDVKQNSESDYFEEMGSSNIKQINKNILESLDSEDVGAEVLRNLHIVIPFTIPPLHVLMERPSKPTLNEISACKDFPPKLGAYSQREDQIIKNNWERFCKEHNLNIEPAAFFNFPQKMSRIEKVKFMQYISHGLENRQPRRVYLRFKTIFRNLVKKTGRFTKDEDKQILEFLETESSKTPFVDLARILNRPSNSVERHYKRLHDQQKINWTPSKAEQLINCMLKVSKLKTPEQLENQTLTSEQWKQISKKMDNISVIKLQRAWNITIYPRLFSTGNLATAKERIIDILYERQEKDWRLVDWKKISKKIPGFSPGKLYMMFKKLVIFNVPKHLQKDLRKSVECLKGKRLSTPHKFRNYTYKNGHLVYADGNDDDEEYISN